MHQEGSYQAYQEQHDPYRISQNLPLTSHQANNQSLSLPKRPNIHTYGGIHINYLLYFFVPLIIFACLYCYHESVKKKEEPPFPHATITSTACHYSQDILFRYFVLPGGTFICLIYYIAYRWLKKIKKETGYPGPIFSSLEYWGQASVLGFYGAIATIDGSTRPAIHGIGAVFFFILLFIISTSITIVVRDMHEWDSRCISRRSVNFKVMMTLYLVGVAIYFIIGSILENMVEGENGEDIYLVTIEWNLTIGGLIWLLSFAFDWGHIFLTLKGDINSTIKVIRND